TVPRRRIAAADLWPGVAVGIQANVAARIPLRAALLVGRAGAGSLSRPRVRDALAAVPALRSAIRQAIAIDTLLPLRAGTAVRVVTTTVAAAHLPSAARRAD